MTRVIAGEKKGVQLVNPSGSRIRPTTDRVKEWIFSVYQSLDGASVLDLFCGAGNLGIEALSRGADHCTFVDRARTAIRLTEENIGKTGYDARATIVRQNSHQFLREDHGMYSFIFADPPYGRAEWTSLLAMIPSRLDAGGVCVFEAGASFSFKLPVTLRQTRKESFGDTTISIFERT